MPDGKIMSNGQNPHQLSSITDNMPSSLHISLFMEPCYYVGCGVVGLIIIISASLTAEMSLSGIISNSFSFSL